MPQEPQPIDLEELTRPYDYYCTNEFKDEDTKRRYFLQFASDLAKSFPALRDELLQYRSGAVKQIVSEINKQVDDSVALRKENAEMRDELVRLRASNAMNEDAANKGDNARQAAGAMESEISRLQGENGKLEKQRNNWKSFADKLQKANISKTRQLDEAKGALEAEEESQNLHAAALELYERSHEEGWDNDPTGLSHIASADNRAAKATERADAMRRTFLASLAGTTERKPFKLEASKEWFEKSATIEGDSEVGAGGSSFMNPAQPTQGEVAWRDVTKSLPEYMTSALVWCPANKNIYCAYYHFYAGSQDPESKPIWCYFTQEETITTLKEEVTHWTTLPTPPQEVEKEQPTQGEFRYFRLKDTPLSPEWKIPTNGHKGQLAMNPGEWKACDFDLGDFIDEEDGSLYSEYEEYNPTTAQEVEGGAES